MKAIVFDSGDTPEGYVPKCRGSDSPDRCGELKVCQKIRTVQASSEQVMNKHKVV